MQIADFNVEDFQNQQNADKGLLVKFYIKPFMDQTATAKEGRPIYVDKEYIQIMVPGQRDFIARPATPADKARFPEHYKMFKERTSDEVKVQGTLLKEWPLISRSQVEELSFMNVKTVEQLAEVADVNIGQMMGMNQLKAKAKEWLEAAEAHNRDVQMRAEMQAQLDARDEEIEKLKAAVKALQGAPKRRVSKKKASRKKKVTAKKE